MDGRRRDSNRQIGIRVRNVRDRLGLSNVEFAKLVGVGPDTVSHWINGKNAPQSGSIARIADAAGVSVEDMEHYLKIGTVIPIEGSDDAIARTVTISNRLLKEFDEHYGDFLRVEKAIAASLLKFLESEAAEREQMLKRYQEWVRTPKRKRLNLRDAG